MAWRRRDVPFPRAGRGRPGCPRDGRWRRTRGAAAGARGAPRRPGAVPGGDYFGRTVNVAARIADYLRQGEVVVSQEVVDAATGDGAGGSGGPRGSELGVSFAPIGPV